MRRSTFAWAAAAAVTVATTAVAAGPAVADQGAPAAVASDIGREGTGEILPYPGPDGLIWIKDWIGNGGAVTGGAYQAGPPVTVTVGCQGSGVAGEAHVTFTPYYGDPTPVEFTVACPADTVGRGTAVVTPEQGRSFHVGVQTSGPDVHWGLTVTQPDA
ncbi:hypothetical protein [Kitasatospora cheerisanensis]|uniref:Secreted protein n=1 Tax=Kitasatospora cheerisanensis KCTC 2395 TaxID=1348663 RepID=A0A066Z020_9ACTN|nr:hypothetical protein [Kitasatospora cheerisanensis]KDN86837.1 hypothetical protein KCH_14670 [Kitasatospora cheerisanensis KCTC 2395]